MYDLHLLLYHYLVVFLYFIVIFYFYFFFVYIFFFFFFSSRRRHTRSLCDWSSDVCSSDLTDRDRTTSPVPRAARRGSTSSASSPRISDGTPGSKTTTRARSSTQSPGAVPRGLGSTVAPSGTSACVRFTAGIARPRRRNRSSSARSTVSSSCSALPNTAATSRFVMSSRVGPRPPVVITKPVRSRASLTAARISSGRSATEG